jgi:sugar phosphate isomerase/epimerase
MVAGREFSLPEPPASSSLHFNRPAEMALQTGGQFAGLVRSAASHQTHTHIMFKKHLLHMFTTAIGISLTGGSLLATAIPDSARTGGFAVGCQAWTFNRFTAMEAVEKTALAGGKVIEFYPGQKFSAQKGDLKWDHNATDDMVAAVKAQLAKHGVRAVNYGVVGGKDEAEWQKIFEFAKKLDLYAITTEDVGHLDIIEKLVKEFDVRVAVHNHPRQENNPNYKVWEPAYVLSVVKDRDARIGACADIGHWQTSGISPVDGLRTLKGRIVSMHMKDRTAIGRKSTDVPFGSGLTDLKGVLEELKAQNFAGNISVEYETNWENSLPEVSQCIGFFRGYGAATGVK